MKVDGAAHSIDAGDIGRGSAGATRFRQERRSDLAISTREFQRRQARDGVGQAPAILAEATVRYLSHPPDGNRNVRDVTSLVAALPRMAAVRNRPQ